MNIKYKIFLISGLLFITGCKSVENKIIDMPTYSKEKKVYSVFDNKPVNGVLEKEGYYGKREYFTYKKGTLYNLKKISKGNELLYEVSFDGMGLFNGKTFEEKGKSSEYSHGVLDGEVIYEDYRGNKIIERYADGILNGVQEKKEGKKLFFNQGLRTTKDIESPTKKQSKVIIWGELPKENFTGELYGKPKTDIINNNYAVMQIENYKNGVLLSRKYYDKQGKKMYEFNFVDGDVKKIVKKIEYTEGILRELKNYNSDGVLNGKYILRSYYSTSAEVKNYINGIPHGEVEILIEKDGTLDKKIGFYDKGIYTGYKNTQYYKDGIEIDKELSNTVSSNFIITNIKGIKNKESFSGYTKQVINSNNNNPEDWNIYYYENGFLKEEYKYKNNFLIQSKHYLENEKYIQKTYKDGIVQKISNYNDDGIEDGTFTAYEHENSKTVGHIVNGVIDGESIHYHGSKIYYVDVYSKGKNYQRTIYYDYEKKQISQTQKGINTDRGWIRIGMDKTYYEDGKLKKVVNYGDGLSSKKKVEVTEFYSNGKIKSKGTMDYCLYKNIGKKTTFYENGKKKIEENYNDRGYKDGSFKTYNKDGKLIEELHYKNGYKK